MELINSRYKIVDCVEKEHGYSQYIAWDLLRNNDKVFLYLVNETQATKPFIEYCNNNFYEKSSYKQESLMKVYGYDIVETIDDKHIDDTIFFYTTDYIESKSIASLDTPLNEYEILSVYKQISCALDFLFYRGIVYKYIGVETIKLVNDGNELIVKLLDIISVQRMEFIRSYLHPLTRNFLAPELKYDNELGGYTDVYSLGSLLYYLLTLTQLNHTSLALQIEEYTKTGPGSIKLKLLSLIQKMTNTDVESRYKTLQECNEQMQKIFGLDEAIERLQDVDKLNFKTAVVGRDHELKQIMDVCVQREDGTKRFNKNLVIINGDKTIGKTRLLNEIKNLVKWRKYKAFNIDISQNTEGFREIIASVLKQFIKIAPETLIIKYGKELVKLVPELMHNRSILPSQVLAEEQEEMRLFDRITNFMLDVSMNYPSVLLMDDFHLADKTTANFIDYFLKLKTIKKSPLLLILAYIDEEFYYPENKVFIENWSEDNALYIKLSRLSMEETAKMIKNILGWHKDPIFFASRIMKETEGTPGYIEEIMKELFSQKLLIVDYSTKYKGFAPAATVDNYDKIMISRNIDESILKQVNSLDSNMRDILDVVSLFNTAISKNIISQMLEEKNYDFEVYLSNLTQLKILNEKFDDWGYTYGFHTQDFKKYIYSNINGSRKGQLHIKASSVIEQIYLKEKRENKDELIYHLIQSNQKDKAIDYCIEAGKQMLKLFVYEQANTFFDKAYQLLDDDMDSRKLDVVMLIGEANKNLWKNNDAINYFNKAIQLATLQNRQEKSIDAKNKVGLIYSIRNEFDLAQVYLVEAISKSKEVEYIDGRMEAAYLLSRVYMQIREFFKMKNIAEEYYNYAISHNNLYYMGMFISQMGVGEYFESNILYAMELFKKSVDFLEKANKIEETARPINNIGVIYQEHLQDTQSGRMYFEKALKICQQYHRPDGMITYNNNIADSYIAEHDYYKAIDVVKKNLEVALDYEEEISILLVYSSLIVSYTNIGEYQQAYTYLLKANTIYINRNFQSKGIYLETYLEACTKLYMAMGAFDEAFLMLNEFFDKFKDTEPLILLRMRKLYYFNKYKVNKKVDYNELLSIISEYSETTYIRDRRMILLEGAYHFIERGMMAQAKLLLVEDSSLVRFINNDYLELKRTYIESFLVESNEQLLILESLLSHNKLDQCKEMHWLIHAQFGRLYLVSKDYYRMINSFLNALDVIFLLYNKIPLEFRRSYLVLDDKFLVRENLVSIENLLKADEMNVSNNFKENKLNNCNEKLLNENNFESFFDILDLQNVLENKRFYELALENYDKVNQTQITCIDELIDSLSNNSTYNLTLLLQLACRTTLAVRGVIVTAQEYKYQTIAEVGQGISREKVDSIVESTSIAPKEIFVKSNLNPAYDFNREYFYKDTRAIICLPIYKENETLRNGIHYEDDSENINEIQKKVIGYLYLETDKVLNNFTEDSLSICRKLIRLAAVLITNHNLTIFSSIDKMTGTYVRKYFEQVFEEEIVRAKLTSTPLSVIMFDIDHFKNVNDTFGHQKGDAVLTEIGKIILNSVRSTDYVGRYGGEEFVALLPGTSKEEAFSIAEKTRKRIENTRFIENDIKLTISCGVSSLPYDGNDQAQIIEKADQALYTAKESGRNKSILWEDGVVLKNKRVDKLAGVVTGNIVQDQRNVLVITEIIELISDNSSLENKIFTILGRLVEILEAEDGILLIVNGGDVKNKYYRRRFVEDWVSSFRFNEGFVKDAIQSGQGKYLIDWEDLNSFDPLTNTPNWKSVIVIPIEVNKIVCGVIYLSVPIKEKEFDYNAYNLVQIASSIVGAILKTTK